MTIKGNPGRCVALLHLELVSFRSCWRRANYRNREREKALKAFEGIEGNGRQ
jgi:hypothetical protein